ncbi:transcriptional regulator, AraC family [Desulfotomaculum arcticum]|uniref:Transcriptional regulator, AraC family n=1 Tax=Desulfotruncus arcticus DSM 17038 TaxID=1121424 RepID=A0A1I2UTL4_9FIRM|nr:AraC family transcriptional regulator [Desulfotruncus arcticus]SFG79127.1 transcriptional regulator, AraC family [Desulfotomaculum arcticum] [Desulfotruncus arcticus DSM 17038]
MGGNLTEVLCERRTYDKEYYTHSHPYAQLILPIEGTLHFRTQIHDLSLDSRHLFFLPPNFSHTFCATDRNEFLVLDIPLFVLPDIGSTDIAMYQVFDDRWKAIRFLLLNEGAKKPCRNSALESLIRYAASFLLEEATPVSIQYIHEHYHEKITINQLASLEHFEASYYCKWFYKKTEMTPNAYIRKIRLNKAKEYLRDTNLSILQIAQLVGYDHQSSLTRLFQRHLGTSPKVYREIKTDKETPK